MPYKRRRTGQGAGLRTRRQKKYRYRTKRRLSKKRRSKGTFHKKFQRELGKITEQHGMSYQLLCTKPDSPITVPIIVPWCPQDEFRMITKRDHLWCATGFDPFRHLDNLANSEYGSAPSTFGDAPRAIKAHLNAQVKGGLTICPLNLVRHFHTTTSDSVADYPQNGQAEERNTNNQRLLFKGAEFTPTYLKFDYGYVEGTGYDPHIIPYVDNEIVFGLITNPEDVQNWIEAEPHEGRTLEMAINLVLGNKCNKNWACASGSVGKKYHAGYQRDRKDYANPEGPEVAAVRDELDMYIDEWFISSRKRLSKDIKILKRDMYRHRPHVKQTVKRMVVPDEGEPYQVEDTAYVDSTEAGRLWGQGSFKFPTRFLKPQVIDKTISHERKYNPSGNDSFGTFSGWTDMGEQNTAFNGDFSATPYTNTSTAGAIRGLCDDNRTRPWSCLKYVKHIPFVHLRGSADFSLNEDQIGPHPPTYTAAQTYRATYSPSFDTRAKYMKTFLRWKMKILDM